MYIDYYKEFDLMPNKDKQKLLNLCLKYYEPRETINYKFNSYSLKHKLEFVPDGMYCTNGQFKGAMYYLGYRSPNLYNQNCNFNVSLKSPIFKQ